MRRGDLYLFNGLGSGNIGDEAMFEGWLKIKPLSNDDVVEVFDPAGYCGPSSKTRARLSHFNYADSRAVNLSAVQRALLVGDTPVMEQWGLDWPLKPHAAYLNQCRAHTVPAHAIGIGADALVNPEARAIFSAAHAEIRDWTVRSESCRDALCGLGVNPEAVRVAADLAWLLEPASADAICAREFLRQAGADLSAPLADVNCVSEIWGSGDERAKQLARLLGAAASRLGFTLVLLCNEIRPGEYFDFDLAKKLAALLGKQCVLVPNRFFTPSQMMALIGCCAISISQRYHFTLFSALAGTPAVVFARGQKLTSMSSELGAPVISDMRISDAATAEDALATAWEQCEALAEAQAGRRLTLGVRALYNASFVSTIDTTAPRLASVSDLASVRFRTFMERVGQFSAALGLRDQHYSKEWEYPWLWFNAFSALNLRGAKFADLGSELSPMPWFFALLGASVTIVETESKFIPVWERLKHRLEVDVSWVIVDSEALPFASGSLDALASFSVIEHQPDKRKAVDEIARVLKPGGLLGLSFDICEESRGMTFPAWNGRALTLREFEDFVWLHPAFGNSSRPNWNVEDCGAFKEWNLRSAPHHNYVTGAAALLKTC